MGELQSALDSLAAEDLHALVAPRLLDRTARAGAGPQPDRRRAGPHRPDRRPDAGARARRAEDDAVLAARPRPALPGRRRPDGPHRPGARPAARGGRGVRRRNGDRRTGRRHRPGGHAGERGRRGRAGRRPGRGRRRAGRDRRHPAARAAGPGGAPLPVPAGSRRARARPHRGPLADAGQARRRKPVPPRRARRGRRGEGAGRAGILRPGRPAPRRPAHPRPAARRRPRAAGRQRPRLGHACRSCAPSSRTWPCASTSTTWSTRPPDPARPRPGSAPPSPPPGPAGWPATAPSAGWSWAPTGRCSTTAGPSGSFRRRCAGPSRSATGTACSPAARPRPTGATSTTGCTGSTTERPSPENSALLCERHHTKVHHGFRVERQPDGRWRTYRPDGTEILIGTPLRSDPTRPRAPLTVTVR